MNKFAELIKNTPVTHKETKRWSIVDGIIYDGDKVLNLDIFHKELVAFSKYFREWQRCANMEAQALVVTNEDYEKYYSHFAIIPIESEYKIVILPQYNTPTNTIVDENYWHKAVKGQIVMRVHSHHILHAYQSGTDYNSLNSGTLEVVLGKVHEDINEVAYWLTRHSDETAKDFVYNTFLNTKA